MNEKPPSQEINRYEFRVVHSQTGCSISGTRYPLFVKAFTREGALIKARTTAATLTCKICEKNVFEVKQ